MLFLLLAVLAISDPDRPVAARLVEGHGKFVVHAKEAAAEPSVLVSVPIPYRGQTPLSYDVASEPAGRVRALSIESDGENRFLRIRLAAAKAGDEVFLDVRTLALLRQTEPPDGKGARLAKPEEMPAAMREHLRTASGLDADAPAIAEIAATLPRGDLKELVDGVIAFTKARLGAADGAGPQSSLEVLERGGAVCTGFANISAALLIASGVPARILPTVLVGMDQQEHYIVEAWTPSTGWVKLESTLKIFPLDDLQHLVLRFVDADTPRSGVSVPLHRPVGSGVEADFDMRVKHCWQGAKILASWSIPLDELQAIEAPTRKAFEGLRAKPETGSRAILTPKRAPYGVKTKGKQLLEALDGALTH
jgi:transglutaminase-like putative cysteine protease